MVQLLGGLITYLLLAIYCRQEHNEPVSITRVRELRNQIANEAAEIQNQRSRKQGQCKRRSGRKKRQART
jgi:Rad3-related DNA helicase